MILTTTENQTEADRLAELLVRNKLAACVQTTPIKSTYSWQGEIHQDQELLLIIKTRVDRYQEVADLILNHHTYETPEIVQIPITDGSKDYLGWINQNTR